MSDVDEEFMCGGDDEEYDLVRCFLCCDLMLIQCD
jgi:hypothetical protein